MTTGTYHELDKSTGMAYSKVCPGRFPTAIARAKLADVSVARWYHCLSRCVRKAFLLGEGDDDRREWLENRLEQLADIFAAAVGGFSMMENHLHVLLRLDPEVAQAWFDSAYIDLNPVAAKVAQTPETSGYTSIKQRVDHIRAEGMTAELSAAEKGSVAGSQAADGLEDSLWLCPIEGRRWLDSNREGIMQDFPLGSYVKLVEHTGRLFRQGKASISAELAGIFERLGSSAQNWQTGMERLCGDRLLGRFFPVSAVKLREVAERLGVRHLVNLVGCPIR
jgi:hypothetical protein